MDANQIDWPAYEGKTMTVKEIIEAYLKENGYDGLFSQFAGCCCPVGGIENGGDCLCVDCVPGYRVPCECEDEDAFYIVPDKPEVQP